MAEQENLVDKAGTSGIKEFLTEVGDPINSWNFDIFDGDKPLWLVTKINVDNGKISVRQVLNASGMYDLSGKIVRIVFYSDVPSIAAEATFSLEKIEDVNLSCDASGSGCAEVEAIYNCNFVSVTNSCETVSA